MQETETDLPWWVVLTAGLIGAGAFFAMADAVNSPKATCPRCASKIAWGAGPEPAADPPRPQADHASPPAASDAASSDPVRTTTTG